MNLLRRPSVRRQAAVLVVLLLLPLTTGALWSWIESRRARIEEGRRGATSVATAAAASFEQFLRGLDAFASDLALNPSLIALNRPECDRLFAEILRHRPLLLNVLLSAPDDTIRGSGIATSHAKPQPVMPHVSQVMASGRPVVGELAVGPLTHKPTVILAYPVRSSAGVVVGVLALGLDLSRIQSTFAGVPIAEGAVVTLTNSAGLVLARSLEADRYIGTTIDVPGRSDPEASPHPWQQVDGNGVERFVASAEVGRGPWMMSAGIPTRTIAMRVAAGRRTLALVVVALLAWVALVVRMSRQLSHQLSYLAETARHVVQGDPLPVPLSRPLNREVAELQLAIVTQADSLRQTRAELEQLVEQERKVRDMLETLQRHTVRQERLAAVGLLLSGVAHELNNPLQAIMGAAELLERRNDLPADAQEEVALVGTQVQRAAEIIRHLSRFGTQRPSLPTAIDVQDVVSEVVQLRRTDLEATRIGYQIHTISTGKVFASFTEIEQVVLNFVINAQQSILTAGVTGGLIVIRSFDVENRVRLEVIDNGPGVATDDESKLFQPFFTTKPVGEGTGLGLSVSHGIIESYGGTIGHRPSESGGAVFYFELPRV